MASRSVAHLAVLPASVTVIVEAWSGVHRACIRWQVGVPFRVTWYAHMYWPGAAWTQWAFPARPMSRCSCAYWFVTPMNSAANVAADGVTGFDALDSAARAAPCAWLPAKRTIASAGTRAALRRARALLVVIMQRA